MQDQLGQSPGAEIEGISSYFIFKSKVNYYYGA